MPMPWVAQLVERLKNKAWNRGLPILQLGSMKGGRTQLYRPCSIIDTCLHSNLLHLYVQRCDLWVCFLLLKHWQWEPCNKAYITPYAIYKPCLGWIAPNTINKDRHTLAYANPYTTTSALVQPWLLCTCIRAYVCYVHIHICIYGCLPFSFSVW